MAKKGKIKVMSPQIIDSTNPDTKLQFNIPTETKELKKVRESEVFDKKKSKINKKYK